MIHQRAHFADTCFQSAEYGFPDQKMANVQFGDLRNSCNRRDILEGQTVAGMGFDPVLASERCCIRNPAELICPSLAVERCA